MIRSPFVRCDRGNSNPKSNGRGHSVSTCTYCHRSGHTIEECHQKQGYPVGHPRYPGRPRFNLHLSAQVVNSVPTDGKTNEAIEQVIGPNLPFSQAQIDTLMALLQTGAANSASTNQ